LSTSEAIRDFKAEMGLEGLCLSYQYALDRFLDLKADLAWQKAIYDSDRPVEERVFLTYDFKLVKADMEIARKRALSCLRRINNYARGLKPEGIDELDIERAREYDIKNLVQVNRAGFALCVNHDDKKPSMLTRGNFGYCFSCGWTGDVIAIYQKQTGASFPEAVKALK
jgi:hypothetical protein